MADAVTAALESGAVQLVTLIFYIAMIIACWLVGEFFRARKPSQ